MKTRTLNLRGALRLLRLVYPGLTGIQVYANGVKLAIVNRDSKGKVMEWQL